MTDESIVIESS